MPIREFECLECLSTFDTLVRNQADMEETRCPKCNSSQLESVLTVPGNYTIKGDNSASTRPKKSRARS